MYVFLVILFKETLHHQKISLSVKAHSHLKILSVLPLCQPLPVQLSSLNVAVIVIMETFSSPATAKEMYVKQHEIKVTLTSIYKSNPPFLKSILPLYNNDRVLICPTGLLVTCGFSSHRPDNGEYSNHVILVCTSRTSTGLVSFDCYLKCIWSERFQRIYM